MAWAVPGGGPVPLICRFERGGNAPVNDGAVNGDALCTCRLFDKSRVCTRPLARQF